MKSLSYLCLASFLALYTLLLAGCSGVGTAVTPPSSTPYQLTVVAPAQGTGTITSAPTGINCPGTCTASFAAGTAVTLTATPATGYFFGTWTGCTGTSNSCSVSATASVTGTFNPGLTVVETGMGTVTSSPAGISCPGTCSFGFAPSTAVTLTETPAASFSFADWTGSCSGSGACSVTLTAPTTVTATFAGGIPLTVATAGAGSGTVTSTPAGISCTSPSTGTCTANFAPNTPVTLTETPATNNTFSSWSGACTGTAACSVTVTASSAVTATFGGSIQANINHIILFAQENRSLDHYFGAMREYWASTTPPTPDQPFDGLPQFTPAADCTTTNGVSSCAVPKVPGCNLLSDVDSCTPDPTNMISSFHFASVCEENQSPFWNEAHNDWDYANPADQPAEANPPLNGFVFTAAYDARSNGFQDVNGVRAMGYYEGSDLNYYYDRATKFGTSDRWFSPVMDRTQVNRMFILAATSQASPTTAYAYPSGGGVNDNAQLAATTIFEALQNANITWRVYVNPVGLTDQTTGVPCSSETGAALNQCLALNSYVQMFDYENTIQATPSLYQNFVPITQFATDLQDDATFPQFAFIEPASSAGLDEHPSDSDAFPVNVQQGAKYVGGLIDDFMQSPTWADSVMIFTYDEAGGLYDHVPPQPVPAPGGTPGSTDAPYSPTDLNPALGDICTKPGEVLGQGTCDFAWTGYRVPLIVISPYSVKNFVSHTVRDTTAALAMVESRFGIQPLTGRDGYYYANTSMNEFFDFVNKPWAVPPPLLAQNTAGTCDQTPPTGANGWTEPPVLTVTVKATTSNSGSVTSTPAGIKDCTTTTGACSAPYDTATVVTLTATPGTGDTFTGWTGACTGTLTCSVTMGTGQSMVGATFTGP
jgi:phospholipase C